ncbi:MAG: pre-peptidase C-terminal domain-containing protein [Bacteroidota bacterium]
MHRFLLPLLALAVALPASAQNFSGSLDADDDTRDSGAHYETYTFEAESGDEVIVRMESSSFDTFLFVYSPTDQEDFNDDFEGTSVSQLEFTASESGTYTVWATSYGAESTGEYTLEINVVTLGIVEEIRDRLDPDDKQSIKGEYFDSMTITAPASGAFYVELRALGFDGYLRVVAPSGEIWRNDDFGDRDTAYQVSRIGPLQADGGQWQVDVTTYGTEEVGAYDVRILTPDE